MPEIKFACPACKVTLKVADTLAGKKIKCPKCAAVVAVPAAGAAPAAPPVKPVAPPPAPAKPPAAIKAPGKVVPVPKPPPPPPEPDPIDELMGMSPDDEPAASPPDKEEEPPRRTRGPAPKQGGLDVLSLVGFLLALGYVVFVALVYFGILWPKSSFKATYKGGDGNDPTVPTVATVRTPKDADKRAGSPPKPDPNAVAEDASPPDSEHPAPW